MPSLDKSSNIIIFYIFGVEKLFEDNLLSYSLLYRYSKVQYEYSYIEMHA